MSGGSGHRDRSRESRPGDRDAIARVHESAFGPSESPEIVAVVDALLEDPSAKPLLSLVAEIDGDIVAHVLFTAARLVPDTGVGEVQILAPLGVASAWKGQGVGTRLVEDGLARLAERGVSLVFVLGDPGYYPRFGFRPAGARGLHAPYPILEKNAGAWMVQALTPRGLPEISATVHCARALDRRELWSE